MLLALFLLSCAGGTPAQAQEDGDRSSEAPLFQVGPRIGVDLNNGNRIFIGVNSRVNAGLAVLLNPTLDYHFVEGESSSNAIGSAQIDLRLLQAGINALYPLSTELAIEQATPYLGAGVSFTQVSSTLDVSAQGLQRNENDSDTQVGLAVVGAVMVPAGGTSLVLQLEVKLGSSFELFGVETQGGDFALLSAAFLF